MLPIDDDEKLENEKENEENEELDSDSSDAPVSHSDYKAPDLNAEGVKYQLSGMFKQWFLDYASYVILDRAVPHIEDGLKPVQRRVLHAMRTMEDGRMNKVANVVGNTMQYHPHGDSSIYGALVQLGQKDLMVDTQGNWGNIYTGDDAAAGRYIECRLTKFALDIAFNKKITEWKKSYDGRNDEPVTLPVKFPLLLAQGAEGIAVTLSSIILPHNFNELLEASIACLKGEDFQLYPDFQTAGMIDVGRYNDGARGGRVLIRSHIEKIDNKTLEIKDIPYGETTKSVIASIVSAQEKGKINIRKVDDDTSDKVSIVIQLAPNTSSDKTIDALYAFTKCQKSVSPVCCVIQTKKPRFCNVKDLLRESTEHTKELIRQELEIQLGETREAFFNCSLEKIFIEERIYKDKEYENAKDLETALKHIDKRLEPFKQTFLREVTREDLLRLEEIKMARIHKFNAFESEEKLAALQDKMDEIERNLKNLVAYTIAWFQYLLSKYGKNRPRLTEIRNFDTINATKVVEANEKLYVNKEEGFIGYDLKKDGEFVCNCSDMDDVIIFFKNGKYKVVKIADKLYVGKDILYLNVYKKKDTRTVYNVVYHDGRGGPYYMKRFAVPSVTRDKEYDLTRGTANSRVVYFTANPNAEAEVIRVVLRPRPRLKVSSFERDFGDLLVKGRQSMGNLLTKNELHSVVLKRRGGSTMGGRQVWFDFDVLRLNYDGRGTLLGEFHSDDLVLVVSKNGEYYTTSFDENNHFNENLLRIEKYNPKKIWTAVLFDANEGFTYIKRFVVEPSAKPVNFIGENPKSELRLLSDTYYPRLEVQLGGNDAEKAPFEVDVESFISVKGVKAKGKRLHQSIVASVVELEPLRQPEEEEQEGEEGDDADLAEGDDAVDKEPTLF
ncbi:MAG: DNA gyrase/topoisomerase IV subunit A [Paludibacteraceae bacterium]|nr:DNA gyrase/topoisomerase IV subunit A [Paludibacteraceae bacterium]